MAIGFYLFNTFIHICGCISLVLLAAALTAALYLCAEFCEEYPSISGRAMKYFIGFIICWHLLFALIGVSYLPLLIGAATHAAYFAMLSNYPFVDVVSIPSILSAVGLLASHWVWFRFFMEGHHLSYYEHYDMLQVFGLFVIMVWAAPCGLMVSLTVNENVLPGIRPANLAGTGVDGNNSGPAKKHTIFITLFSYFQSLTTPNSRGSGSGSSNSSGGGGGGGGGGGSYGNNSFNSGSSTSGMFQPRPPSVGSVKKAY
jgi:uncharacterized membrane protein YgcG